MKSVLSILVVLCSVNAIATSALDHVGQYEYVQSYDLPGQENCPSNLQVSSEEGMMVLKSDSSVLVKATVNGPARATQPEMDGIVSVSKDYVALDENGLTFASVSAHENPAIGGVAILKMVYQLTPVVGDSLVLNLTIQSTYRGKSDKSISSCEYIKVK